MNQRAIVVRPLVRPGSRRATLRQVLPAVILAHGCLLPIELSFDIEGAAIFPYRLVLYLFLPLLLARIARAQPRPSAVDGLAAFASAWFVISFLVAEWSGPALVSSVALAADFGLGYLVGRTSVRTAEELRTFLKAMLPALMLVALVLAVESLSHRYLLRPLIADLLGKPPPLPKGEIRMGLPRATGPFPHPILAGVFLASILPLAWYAAKGGWQRMLTLLAAASALFTMSSAAFLGIAIGAVLIAVDYVQRVTRLPVYHVALLYGLGGAAIVSAVAEGGLMSFIFRRMTLDPQTAYYRSLIWEYAGAEAINHPLFGIGRRDWARPSFMLSDSIDAHWLVLAVKYGMPLAIVAFTVTAGAAAKVLRSNRRGTRQDRDAALGLAFALATIAISSFTVALWEGIAEWLVMLCGMAVSLHPVARTRSPPPAGFTNFQAFARKTSAP